MNVRIAVLAVLCTCAAAVHADTIIPFGQTWTIYNSGTVAPTTVTPGAFLTVDISQDGLNKVLFTFTPNLGTVKGAQEDIKIATFNLSPSLANLASLLNSKNLGTSSGLSVTNFKVGGVTQTVPSNGKGNPFLAVNGDNGEATTSFKGYDVKFDFGPGGNSVLSTKPVTFDLCGVGLTAASFDALNASGYLAATQIQNTPSGSTEAAYVPTPAAWASGLMLLVGTCVASRAGRPQSHSMQA